MREFYKNSPSES